MRPIHIACGNGHVDILKYLIDKKCNIECETSVVNNQRWLLINNSEFQGWRPIHFACDRGNADIIEYLIDKKCNIECETSRVNNQ